MTQISIRMDEELRQQTDKILSELGLNISSAVNIFARQIVRSRGIPFPLTLADQPAESRRDAASSFIQFAKSCPVKIKQGYKFNRDECYDE